MGMLVILTVHLRQKGSPESKPLEPAGEGAPKTRRDDPDAPWSAEAASSCGSTPIR